MTDTQNSFWAPVCVVILFGAILCAGCAGGDETYRAGYIVASTEDPAPGEAWALLNGDRESEYILIAPAYKDSNGRWDSADETRRTVKSRDYIERQYPYKVGYAAPEMLARRW